MTNVFHSQEITPVSGVIAVCKGDITEATYLVGFQGEKCATQRGVAQRVTHHESHSNMVLQNTEFIANSLNSFETGKHLVIQRTNCLLHEPHVVSMRIAASSLSSLQDSAMSRRKKVQIGNISKRSPVGRVIAEFPLDPSMAEDPRLRGISLSRVHPSFVSVNNDWMDSMCLPTEVGDFLFKVVVCLLHPRGTQDLTSIIRIGHISTPRIT